MKKIKCIPRWKEGYWCCVCFFFPPIEYMEKMRKNMRNNEPYSMELFPNGIHTTYAKTFFFSSLPATQSENAPRDFNSKSVKTFFFTGGKPLQNNTILWP